jgi:hypothetical protein
MSGLDSDFIFNLFSNNEHRTLNNEQWISDNEY